MEILTTHITTEEDTLYKVANMFYLKWSLWPVIHGANFAQIPDPFELKKKLSLVIPKLSTSDISYTVKAGDTYHTLAEEHYATNTLYFYIQRKNDFTDLCPGDHVTIPALVSTRDLAKAEELRNVCS